MNDSVLVVDLDGSLIKTDLLFESFMQFLKYHYLAVFLLPFWLLKGKAYLKAQIAERVQLDVKILPYNQDVLDYIAEARKKGQQCFLATGSTQKYADQIADYLSVFDGVLCSDKSMNLTGNNKAKVLNERFGEGGYDYIGNHEIDLNIWRYARKCIVVSADQALSQQARQYSDNVVWLAIEKAKLKTYLKAIRLHQWVKNALLFVPLLTAHMFTDANALWLSLIGFVSYGLAASSVYVLNDLLDLSSDRIHPSKCKRPFASGVLSIKSGVLLFPCLLLASFLLALIFTPFNFLLALLAYYILTVAYSLGFKKVVMLDTLLLAILYTMRIIAGTLLIGADFSSWLLAFSMFIFLSLALLKRYTELLVMKDDATLKALGRGYQAQDKSLVLSLGSAAAYISVLVLALYINSEEVVSLYETPFLLWLICPVLIYWLGRAWMLANRGQMHDDPIIFAVKDKQSLLMGLLIAIIFAVASL